MDREPLPHRIRPRTLDEFIGQEDIVGEGTLLRSMIESDKLQSAIFYGPPGTGKTTLAEIIAGCTNAHFVRMNATTSGIREAREAISAARIEYDLNKRRTILFVDECHRHAKNQQEAFLPSVESGTISFIGATTENPYFSVAGPLISRSHIFQFNPLNQKDLLKALSRGVEYYRSIGKSIVVNADAAKYLAIKVDGDARKILATLELIVESFYDEAIEMLVDVAVCQKALPHKSVMFDRSGDGHFDYASCLPGAIQASDPDAAVYWLARSIVAGEDIMYIARRLAVAAAEDVGVGDPRAIPLAMGVVDACKMIGLPECALHLSTLAVFLASSNRNKSAAMAIWEALDDARDNYSIAVPPEMKDCHYKGAAKLGHGAYHDGRNQDAYVGINKRYWKPEEWEQEKATCPG